ncbi:MAG TPA: glycosyltransferase family 4 protein [Streptosporangiaceae bacterium]
MTDATELRGVRIAVANWRDPWHPQAGGAERYAWEMARELAARGAVVRFLTARAPGQSRGERRDGIEIIRLGGQFTVYPLVLGWLLAHRLKHRLMHPFTHRRSVDAVLDCQNGIPFFTPLVLPRRVPVLCVMHHVHAAQFGVHFPGWMARVGRLLEGPMARLVYRRHACVAVSPSTIATMRGRLRWTGDIYLIPNGAPVPEAPPQTPADPPRTAPAQASNSTQQPNLVWVGRLVAHKRAELILPVAERGFTIDVIGRGPAAESLEEAIAARRLTGLVRLRGFLPEAGKHAVVAGSLLHLNTSQGEGWGLCVLEAAALGVPTVAYDVEGLRDSVHDGETGWLVHEGEEFADVVERAAKELADPARREQIADACRGWAAQLGWDRSTARMAELIGACVRAGTSKGTREGAWIVSRNDDNVGNASVNASRTVVAEGPVLDMLISAGDRVIRPATPVERLLGKATEVGTPGQQ